MTIDEHTLATASRSWAELGTEIDKARKPLAEATHLPSDLYTSAAVFEVEMEKIFKKDWLAVARVEEIENPGDYILRHCRRADHRRPQ